MKKIKASVLLAFFVCLTIACEKKRSTEKRVKKCYERTTAGNGITDQLTLNVEFVSDSVSGKLEWLPQEKDSQRGTIQGIRVTDKKYSVHYNYLAEGVKNTEKQTITFGKNIAIITREHESSNDRDAFLSTDTLQLRPCPSVEDPSQK